MSLRLPLAGFLELTNNPNMFELAFNYTAIRSGLRSGRFPQIDRSVVRDTHAIWRDAVGRWFTTEADELETKAEKRASHIKMAGSLLWAFTQGQAVSRYDPIQQDDLHEIRRFQLESNIVEFDQKKGQLLRAYPTQTAAFIFTAEVFNMHQRGRIIAEKKMGKDITRAGIDLAKPPLTSHYFRNLCKLLLDEAPCKADLYMIFKTMDLYGLKHDGST